MQYIYLLIKDGDTAQNINIRKCLHLWSSCAAITSLNFFVWSLGMSRPKLLESHAVGLPGTKN